MFQSKITELEQVLKALLEQYQAKQKEMQELANEMLRVDGALRELKKMTEEQTSK